MSAVKQTQLYQEQTIKNCRAIMRIANETKQRLAALNEEIKLMKKTWGGEVK